MPAKIISLGSYLPEKILTNDELSKKVDTSDEWIFTRTGIKQRHIAAENEFTSDLATKAAQNALEYQNIDPQTIDAIVVATVSPDYTFPSVATLVQQKLGIKNCFAFDIQAACAGFIMGLSVVEGLLASGQAKRILLIGAELFSKFIDWQDRKTCILFGDGAGAAILEQTITEDPSRILGIKIKSDGSYVEVLKSTGGVCTTQTAGSIYMNGAEVFRQAVLNMGEILEELLEDLHLQKSEIDFLIPHQANIRIINAMQERFHVPKQKVIKTIANHANTSSASLILALDYAVKNNIIKKGNLLGLCAVGSGLIWGSCILRW